MPRPLLVLLAAAAVIGASAGTLVAVSLEDDGDGAALDGATAAVLWADQDALHDGDVTVDLSLRDPPMSLERFAGGWVVTTPVGGSDDDPAVVERLVSVVRTDGALRPFGRVRGDGDVSPDGTQYVAKAVERDGYVVWDLETGSQVALVPSGNGPDQVATGGAQFVDDENVATTWSSDANEVDSMVLSGPVGGPAQQVVADDVDGEWAVSPDGRLVAGTLGDGSACIVVRPVGADPTAGDCTDSFPGVPSFAADSSVALTVPAADSAASPTSFGRLGPGERAVGGSVDAPEGSLAAAYLDGTRFAVLASSSDGSGTQVWVCAGGDGCEVVGRSDQPAATGVLGTTT